MSKSNESIASTSNSAKKSGNGGFLKNLTAEPAESTKQKTNQVQKMQQNELNDLLKLKEAALANKNKSQKAKYNSFSKPTKSNTVQKRASPIKHSASYNLGFNMTNAGRVSLSAGINKVKKQLEFNGPECWINFNFDYEQINENLPSVFDL